MCDFTSTSIKGLNKHKAETHVKKNICSLCDKPKLSKKNEWECYTCKSPVHNECMKVHGKQRLDEFKQGIKQYNCVSCKEKICDINQKSSEEENHTINQNSSEEENPTVNQKSSEKENPTVVEIEDWVYCNFCDFSAENESDMENHVMILHISLTKRICSKCKGEFDDEKNFKIHQEKGCNFKCHTCGESFKTEDMLKVHSMTHTNLVDEIVNNVEKHLEEKCRKLEETLASERLIIKRNIENIEELKVLVKKADERTRNVNKSVVEKEEELVKSKDMLNKEICENEKKSAEIIALKLTIARRDKDIEDLKQNRAEPNDNTKKA